MPYKNQKLTAKGLEYEILFYFKQDSHKKVFKALRKDPETGLTQEVLVKVFLDSKVYNEFESLSQVISPYCVRLLGFESFGKNQALILEYINGVSLFQLLKHFRLKEEEASYILNNVYKGLKDLNSYGLNHGDLSLDNILIDDKAQIKLIDFGRGNYEKEIFYTSPFAAPEILKGFQPNFLSDLYSLGVLSVLFKQADPLNNLNKISFSDLEKTYPLLSLDPLKRTKWKQQKEQVKPLQPSLSSGPLKKALSEKQKEQTALKSLSIKVKELISEISLRRYETVKQMKNPSSRLTAPFKVFLTALIFFFSLGSHSYKPVYGLVKIYTHEWLWIESSQIKSYAPLNLLLEEGWHKIKWESQAAQGKKNILISNKKILILNDSFFQADK